jgi:hypothetical protein
MTEKYPLDFDVLEKGSIVDAETCLRVTKAKSDSEHQLGLLKLRQMIETKLEGRGMRVTIKIEGKALRILTDAEASEYNAERQAKSLKHFAVSHMRLCGVDTANLTPEQRVDHERRVTCGGMFLSGFADVRKRITELPPTETARPNLIQ